MNFDSLQIIEFDNRKHRQQVVALWQNVFGYESDHNSPELVIDNKMAVGDGLFFVASVEYDVIGTVMAGYDGHRGWIYSMAILPDYQKKGIGSALLEYAEEKLSLLGCLKVNLQIMEGNEAVEKFYKANGYSTENRISMGKKLYEKSNMA
jgi:ribosomal protein S18 acetylase RimI-like enzyme